MNLELFVKNIKNETIPIKVVEEFSKKVNLPLLFTAVSEKLYDELKGEIENLYPLTMQKKL